MLCHAVAKQARRGPRTVAVRTASDSRTAPDVRTINGVNLQVYD